MLLVRAFILGFAGSLAALGTASCTKASCEDLGSCENQGISDAGGESSPALEPDDAAASSTRPFSCKDFDEATSFCWDFSSDQPKANPHGFGINMLPYPEGRGATAFTSLTVHSRPRAGHTSIRKGREPASAYFVAAADVPWRHVRMSWWTYLANSPASGTWGLGYLQFAEQQGTISDSVFLAVGREQLECSERFSRWLEDGGLSESAHARLALAPPIPTKTWTRLAVDVVFGPSGEVRVAVDGVEVATARLRNGSELAPTHVRAGVGIHHFEGSMQSDGEAIVDDLVVEHLQ